MKTTAIVSLFVAALGMVLFLAAFLLGFPSNFNLFLALLFLGILFLGGGLGVFVVSSDLFDLRKTREEFTETQQQYLKKHPQSMLGPRGNVVWWAVGAVVFAIIVYVSIKFHLPSYVSLAAILVISAAYSLATRYMKTRM